jgi:hypothetical protein
MSSSESTPHIGADQSIYFGSTLDAAPYHGGTDGNYAALALDDEALLLKVAGKKER